MDFNCSKFYYSSEYNYYDDGKDKVQDDYIY